jgi:hypothetical protein
VKNHATRGSGTVTVERDQLRSQMWEGRVPKVACVAAIAANDQAKAQIDRVIKNFRLQNYEGEKQLILLYPHAQADMAELVSQRADGKEIKGVAARSHGPFPSTTAFRYAAWMTDADIIARWNFDEWYHADRLSMQIRALAVTSRPVSLLKRRSILGSFKNASFAGAALTTDDVGWESSIVGEAAWMKEHWMPMLEVERQVLAGVQADSVVQVDMPQLSVFLPSEVGSWEGALHHFGLANQTATLSEEPQACHATYAKGLNLSTNVDSRVESAIADAVGAELGAVYRSLHGTFAHIDENLRSLCAEVRAAEEPLRRDMLIGQVKYIAGVEQQLADQFHAVETLFRDHNDATSLKTVETLFSDDVGDEDESE